ncbi:Butyrophilin subfamily 2 member A1 [Chelonia mydas]|uniref:Butyrophilin subfamily 2 member A1 n=1 Tax=Chelonia mydas TaxID=8469 RepID=M7BX09_CHEMY|nr:Butyrophilin subfamily 2 member A1 [Chelonia mydas]
MSAENMEVRWFRSQDSAVVHLYRGGRDQYGEQMLEYGGRTELLKDDITNGRVSLRIHNIRPSDDGQYSCYFESSVSYEEALLELQVAGLGSDPDISVEGHQDGGIRVVCRSSRWYPEPEAQWRDLQGQILPSASKKITPEADDLFQTEIAIVISEESNQKLSCCVRNLRLYQERESAISIAVYFDLPCFEMGTDLRTPGNFQCTAAGCTQPVSAQQASARWIYTPACHALPVPIDKPT